MPRWQSIAWTSHSSMTTGTPQDLDAMIAAFARTVAFVLAHPSRLVFFAVGSPRQERLAAAVAATGRCTGTGLCIESDRLATLMQNRQDIASQHNPSLALGNILRSGVQSARFTHHRSNNGDDSTTRDHESDDSGRYFEFCPSEGADNRSSQ